MGGQLTLGRGAQIATILIRLSIAAAILVSTYLGYRYVTDYKVISTDESGVATARVVVAALYSRSDLRVARLSGVVQGVGGASRLWGWLETRQVVKAPFEVNYFINLSKLRSSNFEISGDGKKIVVSIPDVTTDRPNIDLARTTVNNISGLFVSRGAMVEMAGKVAGSAQRVVEDKANLPDNRAKARALGKKEVARLFEGAFRAARVDTKVLVRYSDEPDTEIERWDVSRSIGDVLANAN